MTKRKKVILFLLILFANILFTEIFDVLGTYFGITDIELDSKHKEDILNNLYFYALFIIIIGPFLEEIVYRLPLKKSKYIWVSLVVGSLSIFTFDFIFVKIAVGIYLGLIIYSIISKKAITLFLSIVSVLVFTISHMGNYDATDIEKMNFLELLFTLTPQLIAGIIMTLFRNYFSFSYGLMYHIAYNFTMISLAVIFGLNEIINN